jgi:hypothetical protein
VLTHKPSLWSQGSPEAPRHSYRSPAQAIFTLRGFQLISLAQIPFDNLPIHQATAHQRGRRTSAIRDDAQPRYVSHTPATHHPAPALYGPTQALSRAYQACASTMPPHHLGGRLLFICHTPSPNEISRDPNSNLHDNSNHIVADPVNQLSLHRTKKGFLHHPPNNSTSDFFVIPPEGNDLNPSEYMPYPVR